MTLIKKALKWIGVYKYLIEIGFAILRILKINKVKLDIQGISFYADYSVLASQAAFNDNKETKDEMAGFIEFAKGKKTLIDIGAYNGVFSFVFTVLNPNASAYAFEPSPKAISVFEMNLSFNKDKEVFLIKSALGNRVDSIKMQYEGKHIVASSTGVDIEQSTLDNFVNKQGIDVDTIKIDVEGYEFHVLQGAKNVLSKHSPVLFLEIHPARLKNLGVSLHQLTKLLSNLGYNTYDYKGDEILIKDSQKAELRVICSKIRLK